MMAYSITKTGTAGYPYERNKNLGTDPATLNSSQKLTQNGSQAETQNTK